ncbi:hypothetical protein [Chamaesiphon sp.]|uniref:hypothetical protein n=1 Tax=Chamaesiphon sp. TaxID=2814140 RepID=UPI003594249E
MGHVFHAMVGSRESVKELSNRWVLAYPISLPQNFAMIPFTAALFDDIAELMNISDPDPFAEFERLSASAEIVIRDASQFGVLSYIETGYFGGCGTQSAIAWSRGKILLGALKSETTWNGESYEETPIGKSAINKILSVLGVWTDRKKDEFDMLGLGNFRDTESAVSSAS